MHIVMLLLYVIVTDKNLVFILWRKQIKFKSKDFPGSSSSHAFLFPRQQSSSGNLKNLQELIKPSGNLSRNNFCEDYRQNRHCSLVFPHHTVWSALPASQKPLTQPITDVKQSDWRRTCEHSRSHTHNKYLSWVKCVSEQSVGVIASN